MNHKGKPNTPSNSEHKHTQPYADICPSCPKPTPLTTNEELDKILQVAFAIGYGVGKAGGKDPVYTPTAELEALEALIDQQTKEARIDELVYWPLNWALNRKDKVWENMIRSRIATLTNDKQEKL